MDQIKVLVMEEKNVKKLKLLTSYILAVVLSGSEDALKVKVKLKIAPNLYFLRFLKPVEHWLCLR